MSDMVESLTSRIKKAWNVFVNGEKLRPVDSGYGNSQRPDRTRLSRGAERSIITSVYNRIAMDVSAVDIRHVRLDESKRYLETIESDLNNCLTLEANLDQTSRAFIQDAVLSLLDEGCIAIVPVETDINPDNASYKIYSMRVGKIMQWHPRYVQVSLYDDRVGRQKPVMVLKKDACIIENPFYAVMNESSSTLQRLKRKLSLLDAVDEESSSGKLNLIIQLPYSIKTELARDRANQRREEVEAQLKTSKYGIAYIDGTEKVTQLGHSIENNLLQQIEYLTNMVYSQLGISQSILDGTADEKAMLNYNNRVIEPILSSITNEMIRKFLTKTARTQGQSIMFFREPFRLTPVSDLAELADKMTRNEIMSSNEIRQVIGMKPSSDPKADALRNSNISAAKLGEDQQQQYSPIEPIEELNQEGYDQAMQDLDMVDAQLDQMEQEVKHAEDLDYDALSHYASPYYDPEKAHEYYMQNRELKGRKVSAKGLNEEGKKAQGYVKEQLRKERESKSEEYQRKTESDLEKKRIEGNTKVARQTNAMKIKIAKLQEMLRNMPPAEKKRRGIRIKTMIGDLRKENAKMRFDIQKEYKQFSQQSRTAHKTEKEKLKKEYENKFNEEVAKIMESPDFVKAVKKSRSKKKSDKTEE